MAKRKKARKRTNANVPAKGILRDKADRLWSLAVRNDWGHKCCVCGGGNCEAHHLVPRGNYATRYDLNNGVALCFAHHKHDNNLSPHLNAAGWLAWLNTNYAARAAWYMENKYAKFEGTKTADYYCYVIRSLKQYVEPEDYERIVGIKFSAWLDEQEVDDGDN